MIFSKKINQLLLNFYENSETKEKINPRLLNQKKDGPKIKGVGVATNLPVGFYDDKTKDANIRGVETPADKEKRLVYGFSKISRFLELILVEHIDSKVSLDSKLQIGSGCSIIIPSRTQDILYKPLLYSTKVLV